ncbi:MAG: low molecular weight phosphotyrosine protein phosphatase [Muribaculaceae bacterium]|nr:low molecular weight phosphotyrosine protein phosphatase [Muribaculaceae bacterium]
MKNIESIEAISRLKGKEKVRVLFVCLGNICRSPAADGIMQAVVAEHGDEARWEIDSAGTGGYHVGDLPDNRMRIHARRRGYELNHICRQVRYSDFDDFDLIIPMDANNEMNLKRLSPSLENEAKIVPMAKFIDMALRYDYIPDPYYEGAEGFELVLNLLENGCANLYDVVSKVIK